LIRVALRLVAFILPVVDLFTPYLDIFRRLNPQLNLAVIGAENGYLDIAIDADRFVLIPGEYEHLNLRPWFKITMPDRQSIGYP
jgi:hypothetical protein